MRALSIKKSIEKFDFLMIYDRFLIFTNKYIIFINSYARHQPISRRLWKLSY